MTTTTLRTTERGSLATYLMARRLVISVAVCSLGQAETVLSRCPLSLNLQVHSPSVVMVMLRAMARVMRVPAAVARIDLQRVHLCQAPLDLSQWGLHLVRVHLRSLVVPTKVRAPLSVHLDPRVPVVLVLALMVVGSLMAT